MPYSPEQFFEVVADVDSYKKFVPFCVDSRVVKVIDEGAMEAEMSVGFKVRRKRQSRRTMMVRENTGNTRPFRGGCRESVVFCTVCRIKPRDHDRGLSWGRQSAVSIQRVEPTAVLAVRDPLLVELPLLLFIVQRFRQAND